MKIIHNRQLKVIKLKISYKFTSTSAQAAGQFTLIRN